MSSYQLLTTHSTSLRTRCSHSTQCLSRCLQLISLQSKFMDDFQTYGARFHLHICKFYKLHKNLLIIYVNNFWFIIFLPEFKYDFLFKKIFTVETFDKNFPLFSFNFLQQMPLECVCFFSYLNIFIVHATHRKN